jgi:hypothetical protein
MTFSMTITSSLSSRPSVRPPPYMCTVEAKRIVGWALQGVTDQSSFYSFTASFPNKSSHSRLSPQSFAMVRANAIFFHLGCCFQKEDLFLALYHENVHLLPVILCPISRSWCMLFLGQLDQSFSQNWSHRGLCKLVCSLVCATCRVINFYFTRTFADFLVVNPSSL